MTDKEKELIIMFVENDSLDWTSLVNKVSYTSVTLSHYLDLLSNKGIIEYSSDGKYYLSDIMLKRWLNLKKQTRGRYPE